MAIVSKPYCMLRGSAGLLTEVWMEYNDADWREINDDGDPDDFRVVRWYGENHSSQALTLTVQRGNGQNWVSRTIPAGSTFSQDAGGPIRYEFDVPRWTYEWGV